MSEDAYAGKTIDAARRELTTRLRDADIESPELDARILIGAALRLDHTGLAINGSRIVAPHQGSAIESFARRRLSREPVARILGQKEFWGLTFELSPATLVPRPDTETVVTAALDHLRANVNREAMRVADIGTGSGAILLALLSELTDATGIGTDISADALATAQSNAQRLGFSDRAQFVQCDYASRLSGRFDAIVSNPPYIPTREIDNLETDVRKHDPRVALDGGADGLSAYRAIAAQTNELLIEGGALICEVGHDQAADVAAIMRVARLDVQSPPRRDLAGLERVVIGLKQAK